MPRQFLSERESERGGGLTDPFVNPERDVRLEVMLDQICEAFFGGSLPGEPRRRGGYSRLFRWRVPCLQLLKLASS